MLSAVRHLVRRLARGGRAAPPARPPRPGQGVPPPAGSRTHAHPYRGRVHLDYAPRPDGRPDPGEVVWAWVPYEDQPQVGKDRPVVVLGEALDGPDTGGLAVLMLSSKDHTGDGDWLALGSGGWDHDGRPSSVRLDRLLVVAPHDVRREGAALDRERFDRVAAAARARHGWD